MQTNNPVLNALTDGLTSYPTGQIDDVAARHIGRAYIDAIRACETLDGAIEALDFNRRFLRMASIVATSRANAVLQRFELKAGEMVDALVNLARQSTGEVPALRWSAR